MAQSRKLRKRNTSVKKTKRGAGHKPPMEVRYEKPPIWDRAQKAFDLQGGEIFAWGNIIYVPGGGALPIWLIAHEKVHREQQGDDVEGWWDLYLDDPEFRLDQEMEAHIMEYRVFCLKHKWPPDRRAYLEDIGERLASPMYGCDITKEDAMAKIAAGRKLK
jgi:hypothetical protein